MQNNNQFFHGKLYKIQLDLCKSVAPPVHHWFCAQLHLLKGIEYNSSTKGKYLNGKEIVSIGITENCESEKWDTEVEKDKKDSFDNVTNASWIQD